LAEKAEELLQELGRHQDGALAVVDHDVAGQQVARRVDGENRPVTGVDSKIDARQEEAVVPLGRQRRADFGGPDGEGLVDGLTGGGRLEAKRARWVIHRREGRRLPDRADQLEQQVRVIDVIDG